MRKGLLHTSMSSLGVHGFPSASKGPVLRPVSGCLGDKSAHQSVGTSLFQLCLLTAFLP